MCLKPVSHIHAVNENMDKIDYLIPQWIILLRPGFDSDLRHVTGSDRSSLVGSLTPCMVVTMHGLQHQTPVPSKTLY